MDCLESETVDRGGVDAFDRVGETDFGLEAREVGPRDVARWSILAMANFSSMSAISSSTSSLVMGRGSFNDALMEVTRDMTD